jgi:hypothetical protein
MQASSKAKRSILLAEAWSVHDTIGGEASVKDALKDAAEAVDSFIVMAGCRG